MKNKGFTLIELLAVIVILAIIALIAVPIIINIINDSRESSNKRSVELYGKAVENAIAQKQLLEEVPAGNYIPSNDGKTLTYTNNSTTPAAVTTIDVQYSGSKVECETNILYEDGKIYLAGCKVGTDTKEYTYGVEQLAQICTLVDGTSKAVGSKYTCYLDEDRTFYVLENNSQSKNISLIMDRNIVDDVSYVSQEDWEDKGGIPSEACQQDEDRCQYGHHCADTTFGAITAKKALATATSDWTNLLQSQITLPTYNQIYSANNNNELISLDSWLLLNLGGGVFGLGYWTSSASDEYDCATHSFVVAKSEFGIGTVDVLFDYGIRPVITISKSQLN